MRSYNVLTTPKQHWLWNINSLKNKVTFGGEHSDPHFSEDSQFYILTSHNEINTSLYDPERRWLGTNAKHKLVISTTGSAAPHRSQFEQEPTFYRETNQGAKNEKVWEWEGSLTEQYRSYKINILSDSPVKRREWRVSSENSALVSGCPL